MKVAETPLVTTTQSKNSNLKPLKIPRRSRGILLVMVLVVGCLSTMTSLLCSYLWLYDGGQEEKENKDDYLDTPKNERLDKQKRVAKNIAVLSGFVTKKSSDYSPQPRIESRFIPHLINKACYCELWGYDYIFNQTWGFPDYIRSASDVSSDGPHWLDYGMWHRVPHIRAVMDAGYEWVLYADIDYVFQDMMLPLEAFLKQWDHYGKSNVHVFLPDDDNSLFTFSSFAIMVRNSDFGRKLLDNWWDFGKGLCPNGNFPTKPGKYSWTDSDQPGLWYALAKTHHDFYPEQSGGYDISCTKNGYLNTTRFMGPELNTYMRKVRAIKSEDLSKVPNDQPIIWSRTKNLGEFARSGLGVQMNFGRNPGDMFPHAFALHKKNDLPKEMMNSIDRCKKIHGCVAEYNENGKLDLHCRNGTHHVMVVDP